MDRGRRKSSDSSRMPKRRPTVMLLGSAQVGKSFFRSAYPPIKDTSTNPSTYSLNLPTSYHATPDVAFEEKHCKVSTPGGRIALSPLRVLEASGSQLTSMGTKMPVSMRTDEYRKVDHFVFVVDLSRPETLREVEELWIPEVLEWVYQVSFAIVGTHPEQESPGMKSLCEALAEKIHAHAFFAVDLSDEKKPVSAIAAWEAILAKCVEGPSRQAPPRQQWLHMHKTWTSRGEKMPRIAGLLIKKGHGLGKNKWEARWVSVEAGLLSYWKSSDEAEDGDKPKGTLDLRNCFVEIDEDIAVKNGRAATPALVVTVKRPTKRQYHFLLEDVANDIDQDMIAWGFVLAANGAEV